MRVRRANLRASTTARSDADAHDAYRNHPYLFYSDLPAALEWLTRAFGFVENMRTGTPSGGLHAEMSMGGQRIMMGQPVSAGHARVASPRTAGTATMGVFLYLDDVDAHHARAAAAGAEIERPPHDESYGRTYTARDLDGHPWFFTTPSRQPRPPEG